MTQERVLICGANWLGDSVMTLPAVQALKQTLPDTSLSVLTKSSLAAFWRLQPDINEVLVLETGWGLRRTVQAVRAHAFSRAYIFPNSFRSALVPFLARVPARHGVPGHCRAWMLTKTVDMCLRPDRQHQAWEYVHILDLDDRVSVLPPPALRVPEARKAALAERFGLRANLPYAVLVPGAARGPSKQWPAEHFVAVGQALSDRHGLRMVVSGTAGEADLCQAVADRVASGAVSVAGQTSIGELVALLGMAALAVTNDSGGMHLAAAAGCPVVAVFGLTDPVKTGPIGACHRVVTSDDATHSRDIPRHSPEAEACLRSIRPEAVLRAAEEVLNAS